MRRRSTFIPNPGVDFDPSDIDVNDHELLLMGLQAAREEKLTFGLSELPEEIVRVLENSHELHVRWVTEEPYNKSSPYLSSLPPGLHVHYTPLSEDHMDERLCNMLRKAFSASLRCSTPNLSFSRPKIISERFASAASMQYCGLLPSIEKFVDYIHQTICRSYDDHNRNLLKLRPSACTTNTDLLSYASYIDLDYDALSHALSMTVYWSRPPGLLMDSYFNTVTSDRWNLAIHGKQSDRNEVGILRPSTERSPAAEPNDIQMEGFLTVLGQDTNPKATIFSFPSRHQALPPQQANSQQYTTTFDQPTGLHPTLRITFANPSALSTPPLTKPEDSTCALHTYLTLPSVLFPTNTPSQQQPPTPSSQQPTTS